jgi:hypothetical protein
MFRSLFQDHLQGSSFALSAYHASAARFAICLYWYVVVCPLFVFVSSVAVCVLSGRELFHSSRPDSTQAGTLDTNTNRGHTTTYKYRHMTKRAPEAW